jgi:hypothetical protein
MAALQMVEEQYYRKKRNKHSNAIPMPTMIGMRTMAMVYALNHATSDLLNPSSAEDSLI